MSISKDFVRNITESCNDMGALIGPCMPAAESPLNVFHSAC